MEPILPLVAVTNDAKLESRAVEKHKVHGSDGVDLLDFVAELNVLRDGAVKRHNLRFLVAPALEEHILRCFPYHLEACGEKSYLHNAEKMYRGLLLPILWIFV